jgi:hypothetical protein
VETEQTVAEAATSSTPRAAASKTTIAAEGAALMVPVSEVASGMVDSGVARCRGWRFQAQSSEYDRL